MPYQPIRVGRSFHGSMSTKLQSARYYIADSAAKRQVVASLGQSAGHCGPLALVVEKKSQPVGVDNLSNQSYAEPHELLSTDVDPESGQSS